MAFVLLCGAVGPAFLILGLVLRSEPGTDWMLLTGIGITLLDLVLGFTMGLTKYRGERRLYRLRQRGRRARGQVLEAEPSNVLVNDQPVYVLRLRVHGDDVAARDVRRRLVIDRDRVHHLGLGELPVLIDPESGEWDIDWDAAPSDRAVPGRFVERRGAEERLAELDDLLRKDLISRDEYDATRGRILDGL